MLTPHGRAAVRELENRRAGLTPAKDRRRSARQQRETPRDALRALSRVLAARTLPVVPTPQGAAPTGRFKLPGNDDLDDDAALERPRLSLALENDEDEDDSLLLPPRSAGLEDENFTVQSVEMPRRATSEKLPGRLSRGSFGSIRMSDQFADLSQGGVFDSSFAVGGPFDDEDPDMGDGLREYVPINMKSLGTWLITGRETVTLRDLGGRISQASGRDSDIRPLTFPGDDTENDFVFTVPQREVEGQEDEQSLEDPQSPNRRSLHGAQESLNRDEEQNGDWDEVGGTDAEDPDEVEVDDSELPRSNPLRADIEMSLREIPLQDPEILVLKDQKTLKKRKIKISRHGIQYPSLPAGVVKKLATTYARTSGNCKAKISKDTLDAIMQASDWFFEQISDDLGAYAKHAGRKTIDESDVVTLMRRYVFFLLMTLVKF